MASRYKRVNREVLFLDYTSWAICIPGAYLVCACLEVPQRRFEGATRQEAVLQTLQELEEGGLVGEGDSRIGYPIVANQNELC